MDEKKTLQQLAYEVVKAWHSLRVEEVRVHGNVKVVHVGRCGAEMNALLDACEALACCESPENRETAKPWYEQHLGSPGRQLLMD